MSSFASLRDQRRSRQPVSLVVREPTTANASEGTSVSVKAPVASPPEQTSVYSYESGLYSQVPANLEIRVSEKRGRGIWVKQGRSIKAGSTLIRVPPHAAALSSSELDSHCSACFLSPSSSLAQVGELKRCTGCSAVWYCSRACQTHDWPAHKEECKRLKALSGKTLPGEAVRSLGRLVWGRHRVGKDSAWWKEVEAMQSHIDELPATHHEPLTMLGLSLSQYLGVDPQKSSPEETSRALSSYGFDSVRHLVNFLARFGTNSFSLTTPDLSNVGVCISPLAALISHSCEPNAVVVFPWGGGPKGSLEVVAIRDLEAGEEVLTSYVDVALSRDKRQSDLKNRYLFTCECSLCTREADPRYVDPRRSIRCRVDGCKGRASMPSGSGKQMAACKTCRQTFEVDVSDVRHAIDLGEQALEKAEQLQSTEPDRAVHLITSVLPHLSAHLCISGHPLLSLLRLYQTLLIATFSPMAMSDPSRSQLINDACRCGALVLSGMADVHPPGHPARAIEYVSLAKLLLVEIDEDASTSALPAELRLTLPTGLDRLSMAMDLFGKASVELARGFGKEGGLVGRDVRLLMEGLEREIKMWKAFSGGEQRCR